MKTAASATIPVLVCTFAIFLLSAMDAGMKSLVIAVGVYNVVLWRSMLAAAASAAGWAARSPAWPGPGAMRLHVLRAAIVGVILITFFWGLAHSRRQEHEADLLALCLARDAGGPTRAGEARQGSGQGGRSCRHCCAVARIQQTVAAAQPSLKRRTLVTGAG